MARTVIRIDNILLSSIAIGILCCSNLIFNILYYGVGYSQGFYITTLVVMLLLVNGLSGKNISKNVFRSVGTVIILVLALFFISNLTGNVGDLSAISFIGYCIIPLLCSFLSVNAKRILETIMIISLASLLIIDQIFSYQFVTLQQTDMSRAYAIFVAVSASLIHFTWYRKESSILFYGCYLCNLYFLIRLILVGNRGIILSLFVLAFVIVLRLVEDYDLPSKKKTKWIVALCAICAFAVLFIINMESIIIALYDFCNSNMESTPSFVIKMYKLIVYKSDVSNGRDSVYQFCLDAIGQSLVWGYGIDTCEVISNGEYPYPHNYILQMLFEGGILFAAYPIYISLRLTCQTLFKRLQNKDTFIFSLFLLCNCIPKLLVSGTVWNQPIFWLWIGMAAINPYKSESNRFLGIMG